MLITQYQLASPLLETIQVAKTGEGGGGSQVETLNSTYGKISLQNNRLCKEQFKDKDFVVLHHSWRLLIT